MSILITGLEMPTERESFNLTIKYNGTVFDTETGMQVAEAHEIPPHGRLIDADALRAKMYHEAFETDSPMQKWDSGCWIRYKMFERMEEAAPTVIEAEEGET